MRITINNMSNADLLMMLCGPVGRILAKRSLTEVFGFKPCRQKELAIGEDMAPYVVHPQIDAAKELITRAMHESLGERSSMTQMDTMKSFFRCNIGHLEYEVFWCLYLDAQNRMIAAEEAFRGTLTQTSVYPREIVKRALILNAAAVVFSHNHPSGETKPSRADENLTQVMKQALGLIDVRVLDHIIVSGEDSLSMAEKGLV